MEPIKLNLASSDYNYKHILLLIVIGTIISAFFITAYNISLWFDMQNAILQYEKKILVLEKRLEKEKYLYEKTKIKLEQYERDIIKNNAVFVNNLIISDIFPWDHILDMLEKIIPDGLILESFLPSDSVKKIILKGHAESTIEIFNFLKRLEQTDMVSKNVLLKLSVEQNKSEIFENQKDTGMTFEIESTLCLTKLFSRKIYGKYGKILCNSSEKY
ncbi:putative PilN domain-containing protein [Candidatus Magnetomoraceae bacterium gMMP-15]